MMWRGWKEKDELYRAWAGVQRGSVEEEDHERTGRKLYVKTSDARI